MPLVKSVLKQQISDAFKAQTKKEDNPESAIDDLAALLADAIDAYVKSGTVSTQVTGTCATPAGPGTIVGSGTGTIS